MQHLRERIAKSDVRTTYVPTHPALCLSTSVPRQKLSAESEHSDVGDRIAKET